MKMKIVISALVILVLLIGAQSAYGASDIDGKPIIFTDSQGRSCNSVPLMMNVNMTPRKNTGNFVITSDYHSGIKVGYTDWTERRNISSPHSRGQQDCIFQRRIYTWLGKRLCGLWKNPTRLRQSG